MTKQPIVNLVLGLLLITISVLLVIFETDAITVIEYILAAVIIIYAGLFFNRSLHYYKKRNAKLLVGVELLISVLVAILLVSLDALNAAMAIGLVLYIRGAMFLTIYIYLRKSMKLERYFVKLLFITLGAYLFFTANNFERYIIFVLAGVLILYGLVLVYFGIQQLRASKSLKEESVPHKPAPTKHQVYTKESLMNKHVDELRTMCKNRNIKGYSNMKKETLVEKLWLYEHDNTKP